MNARKWKEQEVRFDRRREAQEDKGTQQADKSRKEANSTARRVARNVISLGMY